MSRTKPEAARPELLRRQNPSAQSTAARPAENEFCQKIFAASRQCFDLKIFNIADEGRRPAERAGAGGREKKKGHGSGDAAAKPAAATDASMLRFFTILFLAFFIGYSLAADAAAEREEVKGQGSLRIR